jgi:zinc and cadmium transporter
LFSVIAVSLVSLVGLLTLSMGPARLRKTAAAFACFAIGSLLGDVFIHLLPEIFGHDPGTARAGSLLVLLGLLFFFVLEKLLRRQHARESLTRPEQHAHAHLAAMNLVGDAIHNFVDGMLIGASYLVSPELGLSTTIAVFCHELPQELADFGILVHSGLGLRRAVILNVASASVAVVGTIVALSAGTTANAALSTLLVPITAGGFIYIATADLIPSLETEGLRAMGAQVLLILLGIVGMAAVALLE